MRKITLTEEQTQWLIAHFSDTSNSKICAEFGISVASLQRIATSLGLKKSREYLLECKRDQMFKPGVTPLQRYGEKINEQRKQKSSETRKAIIRKERARLAFGLPQKTKIKLTRQDRAKIELRWYLKYRGYRLDEERRLAIYDESTRRCTKLEVKGNPYYQYISAENVVNYATNKGQNVSQVIVNNWGSDFFELSTEKFG